jgi:hypothetical protein
VQGDGAERSPTQPSEKPVARPAVQSAEQLAVAPSAKYPEQAVEPALITTARGVN